MKKESINKMNNNYQNEDNIENLDISSQNKNITERIITDVDENAIKYKLATFIFFLNIVILFAILGLFSSNFNWGFIGMIAIFFLYGMWPIGLTLIFLNLSTLINYFEYDHKNFPKKVKIMYLFNLLCLILLIAVGIFLLINVK